HHRAFPGHPGGQRFDLLQSHVGGVADAALGGPSRDGVLHAVAGEDFEAAVVELDGNRHRDLAGWRAGDLGEAFIQVEPFRRFFESNRLRTPGVLLVIGGYYGHGAGATRRYHVSKECLVAEMRSCWWGGPLCRSRPPGRLSVQVCLRTKASRSLS